MNPKALKCILSAAALSFFSIATVGQNYLFGVTNDVWDVSGGTVVTSYSGEAWPTKPENMLGGVLGSTSLEVGNFIGEDGMPPGFVHFVEWKTPAPVTIRSIRLHAQGDGPIYDNGRDFFEVAIFAKSLGSTNFDVEITAFTPTHPYTFIDFANRLVLSQNVTPVTAQEFRVEYIDTGVRYWSAPRIFELDGFDVPLNEAPALPATPRIYAPPVIPPGTNVVIIPTNRPHGPVITTNFPLVQLPFDNVGTDTDLWDVKQGAQVTAYSAPAAYFESNRPFQPECAFGANFSGFGPETGVFTFADGNPAGHVHFIEWRTPNPVTVRSFKLHAQGDGPIYSNQREFAGFTLKAKSAGSTNFDITLYQYTPTHPYLFQDTEARLLITASVAATTAQEFRAEFVDQGNTPWSAPRIFELDGFSEELPLAVTLYPAVEVGWLTQSNKVYQLQWKTLINQTNWTDFGTNVVGDGTMKFQLDSIRSLGPKIYRVIEVDPVSTSVRTIQISR